MHTRQKILMEMLRRPGRLGGRRILTCETMFIGTGTARLASPGS